MQLQKRIKWKNNTYKINLGQTIKNTLDQTLWFFNNDHLGKTSSLSNLVSKVCDKVFDKTPVIKNELINRDKVSGVSVSASKELLEHMIKNGNELYFGIPKFPPSKFVSQSFS